MQRKDPELSLMIKYLEDRELPEDRKVAHRLSVEANEYVLENGVLFHLYYPRGKGPKSERVIKQLAVPHSLRNDVLLAYHDALLAGHQGIKRTYHAIRLKYFWVGMYEQIWYYVKSCETCARAKRDKHHRDAPLKPLPVEDVFSRIHMDILGPLPKTKNGYRYILLIVDSFSKWCEAFPLATYDAGEVARVLYNEFICRYGAPECILTDRGQNFVSLLIKELYNIFQITKIQTTSYHPSGNAACERLNDNIASAMRA